MKIQKFKVLDEYMTPQEAVEILLPYLKPNSKIWCPFDDENSQFVKLLTKSGHTVEYSHIKNGSQQDFFNRVKLNKLVINWECDYIISNPPWSIKDKILAKLYELDIPFAMLLPTYCLGGGDKI